MLVEENEKGHKLSRCGHLYWQYEEKYERRTDDSEDNFQGLNEKVG